MKGRPLFHLPIPPFPALTLRRWGRDCPSLPIAHPQAPDAGYELLTRYFPRQDRLEKEAQDTGQKDGDWGASCRLPPLYTLDTIASLELPDPWGPSEQRFALIFGDFGRFEQSWGRKTTPVRHAARHLLSGVHVTHVT